MTTPSIARGTGLTASEEAAATAQRKSDLRAALLAARKALLPAEKAAAAARIGAHLLAWLEAQPASGPGAIGAIGVLGVYWPIRGEPDLRDLYVELARRGVTLALPAVLRADHALQYRLWRPGDELQKDAFGVATPAPSAAVTPDLVLAPCVGFNANRIRLGYGGGFYDRTLAALPETVAIGIAYDNALADFEGAAHDVPLSLVLTQNGQR